ncbi:ATP-dependent DNA helicase ii [Basidiobolus meristosporus CBS 931.73]|uniref:ATP-dependent DNA helicase II subunit 1 n=1 Tax=Basidiobolus meristosporus CBS 931.73 TaxID=1314790 RepID=A0A1Y1YJN9_9FUNG|nr:ATP-dependent DNA helicase ii [Basidiobolus meristosporus CBS 931.73]|eukprot:ORX98230.1 ATP-dependent DNA helicase ii [Basidiobolus meristosporus CBS 931.73]
MFEIEEDWDLVDEFQNGDEVPEESAKKTKWNSKDCTLFVIDCSPSMLEPNENKEIPEETKNPGNLDNIYVLQNLESPDATNIKLIENLVNNFDKLRSTVTPSKTELPLGNVFWACSSVLSSWSGINVSSKKIMLITNEDNPNRGNGVLQKAAKTRAKDLYDAQVEIELINLDKQGGKFNSSLFYKDILPDLEENCDISQTSNHFEKLLTRIKRKEARCRSVFTTLLKITNGLEIGIRGYALVGNQQKGSYRLVYMKSETPQQVKAITHWLCADTTQILQQSDLKFYYEYGGDKVVFTKEEIVNMKKFGEPALGLQILGFKPRDRLKFHQNMTHSLFIYPDETVGLLNLAFLQPCMLTVFDYKQYTGSTSVFTAFLLKMCEMDQVAICSFIPRKNTAPRLVAMLPQVEDIFVYLEFKDELGQKAPPGFHLIPLPFADDLRPVSVKSEERASESDIDAAKQIVSKLLIKQGFHPKNYSNPALQRHYMSLQAIALERDIEEAPIDCTLPDVHMIHEEAGDAVQMFKQALGVDDFNEPPQSLPPKRRVIFKGLAPNNSEKQNKRAKTDGGDSQSVESLYQQGKLLKTDLLEYLESIGIHGKGTKPQLIEQIENYFKLLE